MADIGSRAVGRRRPGPGVTLAGALRGWSLPPLPAALRAGAGRGAAPPSLTGLGRASRRRLMRAGSARSRARLELALVDWVWAALRANIRRGRLFEEERVLRDGRADCLGYARLFRELGRALGLDAGIVEVLVDNAGRAVPHVINIVRLADGRRRFIDLWYGSGNIRHRRLGLMARRGGRWRLADVDWRDLPRWDEVKGLPPRCVEAIAGYMAGNRHLEKGLWSGHAGELRQAVRRYTGAIEQYPGNSRARFNRAVALENLGDRRGAEADYAVALRDQAALIRVLARQHEEVVGLMHLDHLGLSAGEEGMYLRHAGFITGSKVPPEGIAARHRLPVDEVAQLLLGIESRLAVARAMA